MEVKGSRRKDSLAGKEAVFMDEPFVPITLSAWGQLV